MYTELNNCSTGMTDSSVNRKAARNTNIEWLRIISTLLIISFHAVGNGYTNPEQPVFIYGVGIVLGSWGILGVDLFLIVSAWFLSTQEFRSKKVIHIVFQVFTWVLGYTLISVAYDFFYHHNAIGVCMMNFCKYALQGFFQPFWCHYYWFVTTYVFMLLLSPALNKLLNTLNSRQLKKLLVLFIFVPIYAQFKTSPVCDVFVFLYVYLLIGYIKRYGSQIVERYAKIHVWTFLMSLVLVARFISLLYSGKGNISLLVRMVLNNTFAYTERHSMILLLIAILVFFNVLNMKPRYNNTVNGIASCCLGAYLFHGNAVIGLPQTIDVIFGILNRGGNGRYAISY